MTNQQMKMDKVTRVNNEGVRYFLNEQFAKAEKCYKEALKLNPDYKTALNNMGLLYHQKKQYEKAIEYFKKAIRVDPKDTYYVNAGNAAASQNKVEDAESWYLKALEANENCISAKESLAKLYEYNNQPDEAARLWINLIKTTGKERFRTEYAKNLIKQERYKEAVEILHNQVSKEKSHVWFLIGMCEYQLCNFGLAEEALKNALAIDPDNEETRRYLAVTYLAMGETEKGILQFDKILKMNPGNYQILTEKGVILLSLNRPAEALELFNKSLAIRPDFGKAEKYRDMVMEIIRNVEH